MGDSLAWLGEKLSNLQRQGLIRPRCEVKPLPDGFCQIDGRRLRNFAANDYLNLAHDPRLIEAAREVLATAGLGSRASALVSGRSQWQAQLERQLADFEGQEAALVFPTGYAANVGTLSALIGSEDVIFCDRLNHASLIDGCRLSQAKLRVYRHDELEKLERQLQRHGRSRRRWIVTDSLFSMDGNAAPLRELADLAERYEASLLVDEAHGTGVFGDQGRGVSEWLGLEDRIAVRIGTLSKALGTLGGFVTGSQTLIDWLWNRARTQMFSTALPPAICAAASAALRILREEPWRRRHLHRLASTLRRELRDAGCSVPGEASSPIIPVLLNQPDRAIQLADQLKAEGFLVAAIRPPTVPKGTSRLRITVSSAHSEEEVGRLAERIGQAMG